MTASVCEFGGEIGQDQDIAVSKIILANGGSKSDVDRFIKSFRKVNRIPKLEIGREDNMPAEAYHALPFVSASLLRKFHSIITVENKTLAHVKLALEEPFVPTWQSISGTMVHALVLEPDKELPGLAIEPVLYPATVKGVTVGKGWTYAANYCKDWKLEREAQGLMVLSAEKLEGVKQMSRSLLSICGDLLEGAATEVTMIGHETGLDIHTKARLDLLAIGTDILDIKSTADISDKTMRKIIHDRGIHMQGAWYVDRYNDHCGADDKKTGFVILAVENEAPFLARRIRVERESLDYGREQNTKWLPIYSECVRSGKWPGYSDGVLGLPSWVGKEREWV